MALTRMKSSDHDTLQLVSSLMAVPREHFLLSIKEQPQQASACSSSTSRGDSSSRPTRTRHPRWPVEPPPVIEINLTPSFNHRSDDWLVINSPNCFCVTEVLDASSNQVRDDAAGLTGATVSSIYKVKDSNNSSIEHGYFVFPDLWIQQEGVYKLRFTLFEMNMHSTGPHATKICYVDSNAFPVKVKTQEIQPPPAKCQTYKDLQEAGLKIKMRKRVNKRARLRDDWSASLSNVVFDAALQRMDDGQSGRIRGTNLRGSISRQPKSQHGSVDGGLAFPVASDGYPSYVPANDAPMRSSYICASDRSPDDGHSYFQFPQYQPLQPVTHEHVPSYAIPTNTHSQHQGGLDIPYLPVVPDNQMQNSRQDYQQMYDAAPSYPGIQGIYGHGYPTSHQFTTQQQGYGTSY